MFNKLYTFVKDDEFRLTIYKNKVHVINYLKINSLRNDFISITGNYIVNIRGSNLVLKKLLDAELLIVGNVLSLEVVDD